MTVGHPSIFEKSGTLTRSHVSIVSRNENEGTTLQTDARESGDRGRSAGHGQVI